MKLEYTGFHPKNNWKISRVDVNIDPVEFFEKYIITRTPCILTGFPAALDWLTLDHLKSTCGDRVVQVERKKNGSFGHGNTRTKMKFAEFVEELPKGNLYLTTQYQEDDEIDEEEDLGSDSEDDAEEVEVQEKLIKSFAAPPLDFMISNIPFALDIFSGLILFQINLWIGMGSEKGATTGLHHDFHDNFYLLKQGRKRFTLFSPKDADKMYTCGTISRVFRNGLIEYENDENEKIRGDGAYLIDVARWKVEQAEFALENADEEDKEELEKVLDELMDEMFKIEGGLALDLEEHQEKGNKRTISNESANKKQKIDESENPPSFSRVPVEIMAGKESKEFPLISKASKVIVDLLPNETLYLPAGWFHEVTSFGKSEPHVALNYWLAPPTADDPKNPYTDDFWRETRLNPILEMIQSPEEEEEGSEDEVDELAD
ncbi:hypothetical protein HDV01_005323 [Terramyces sp. JEL0728]|nr:hypothetical protein HDV01_005323 [Terramyces sp. JEL0728]